MWMELIIKILVALALGVLLGRFIGRRISQIYQQGFTKGFEAGFKDGVRIGRILGTVDTVNYEPPISKPIASVPSVCRRGISKIILHFPHPTDSDMTKENKQSPRKCKFFYDGKCFAPKTILIIGRCATCPLIYDQTHHCYDFDLTLIT